MHRVIYSEVSVAFTSRWIIPSKFGALDALELMFIGVGVTALSLAVFIYTRINAKRDADVREQEEKGVSFTAAQLRAMGDRAPDFRYTL